MNLRIVLFRGIVAGINLGVPLEKLALSLLLAISWPMTIGATTR